MTRRPLALDLFCGAVGAWSLGLHRAGYETVAACEIDPWRRAVFSHNFPNVRVYEDVRSLRADQLVRDVGRLPDIVVGSPPCQDASAANTKGRGVDGARTGLFFEAIRIVGECRPRWCAFENSPRLRTRGYDRIAESLEKIGYACWPPVVGADDIGAPHERKRVWIVAFDAESFGTGRGRPWRRWADGFAAASVEEHAADSGRAISEWWRTLGGRQRRPEEIAGEGPAHADGDAGRVCPSSAALDGRGAAGQCAAENNPHADRDRQHGFPGHVEMAGELVQPGDANGAGLPLWQSLGDDARAQLAALERAVGPAVHSWNGGAARHIGMAHGIAGRLADIRVADFKHPGSTINAAKACISAHGDSILPQIAEGIGRAILRTEAALAHVSGRAA